MVKKVFGKNIILSKVMKLFINISDFKEENARMRTATQHTSVRRRPVAFDKIYTLLGPFSFNLPTEKAWIETLVSTRKP